MNVRSPIHLAWLVALPLLGACDRRDMPENQPQPEPAAAAPQDAMRPEPGSNAAPAPNGQAGELTADEALALGLLASVNEHEIAAARQAKEKNVSAPVLTFADMMETQHGENLAKTRSLGSPADTPEVQAMKDKARAELDELGKKSGRDYETAYVDAMVKGHMQALTLIDTRLNALASSDAVKQHLAATRDAVSMHLEAAKKLQAR